MAGILVFVEQRDGEIRKTSFQALSEAKRQAAGPGWPVAAVATRDPARAAPFAEIAPGLTVHDSYEALLADPEIDAARIGQAFGKILLMILFVLFVTPMGWLLRLFGKDLLAIKCDPQATTYWRPAARQQRQQDFCIGILIYQYPPVVGRRPVDACVITGKQQIPIRFGTFGKIKPWLP